MFFHMEIFLDRCPKILLLVGAWYDVFICNKVKFLERFGQISEVGGWFWRCKGYLRDHIICISDSSQTSFIFCIQAFEIHTFFWKYFYPLEEVRCVGLLALFVRLGIWWWLKSALLLEYVICSIFPNFHSDWSPRNWKSPSKQPKRYLNMSWPK